MDELANYALKSLGSGLLDYYGIWSWLKTRSIQTNPPNSKRTFDSVAAFWEAAISDELLPGQIVRFKNAFLTEWVPRRPGALWKNPKSFSGLSSQCFGTPYYLQRTADLDPFGVTRYPTTGQNAVFTCLGLTTHDAWRCDMGVPIVVSRAVANEFLSKAGDARVVEAELTGLLEFGSPILAGAEHLRSHGSSIDTTVLEAINQSGSIPRCNLYLDSVLDMDVRQYDSHPPGYLWAIQRVQTVSNTYAPLNGVKQAQVETIHHVPAWEYRFEAACLDLKERDQVNNFAAIVRAGGYQKDSFPPGPEREEGVTNVQVLTEFDARSRYFDNPIRVSCDPTLENYDTQLLEECLIELAGQVRGLNT